jgi:hypothetical protein
VFDIMIHELLLKQPANYGQDRIWNCKCGWTLEESWKTIIRGGLKKTRALDRFRKQLFFRHKRDESNRRRDVICSTIHTHLDINKFRHVPLKATLEILAQEFKISTSTVRDIHKNYCRRRMHLKSHKNVPCDCPPLHSLQCSGHSEHDDQISCDICGGPTPICNIFVEHDNTICERCQ